MIYEIAGLRVNMPSITGRTKKQAQPYLSDNQESACDIEINVSRERIEKAAKEHPELNEDDWEYMLTGGDFYRALLKFDGIMLHASCLVLDGKAYAFSADSGVGKSTHTRLWLEKHKNAYILNDDKPAIRLIDGRVYACGTPWSGSVDCSVPKLVVLKAICFLSRAEKNSIKKADTKSAVFNIFSQTVRKLGEKDMDNLFEILNTIFEKVELYELKCNMSRNAVDTAEAALINNN